MRLPDVVALKGPVAGLLAMPPRCVPLPIWPHTLTKSFAWELGRRSEAQASHVCPEGRGRNVFRKGPTRAAMI
jgi:hypothetical protein